MPARSAVLQLPDEVRAALDRELVKRGFSGYEDLSIWLEDKGFAISKSAVHRYGKDFEERLSLLRLATEQAKAIQESVGDDGGALGEALTALAQEKAFQVLMKMSTENVEVSFDRLIGNIGKLNSASVQQKRWAQEVRVKTRAAAEEVEKIATKAGLSEDAAALIRAKILGIAE